MGLIEYPDNLLMQTYNLAEFKEFFDTPIYIAQNSSCNIVFKCQEHNIEKGKLELVFDFINACGYGTTSTLIVDLVKKKEISYKVTTFEDINPYLKR